LLGVFFPPAFFLLFLELFIYFLILFIAGLKRKTLGLPIAIAIMHISWGSGLIWSALKGYA